MRNKKYILQVIYLWVFKKEKIRFDTHKMILLDCFFNQKQHDIIKFNFFKNREEILEKLVEKNYAAYIWYLFKKKIYG